MPEKDPHSKERISIWTWVGIVLSTFGAIILATGILQCSQPPKTVLGHLEPRIWWGGTMLATGILFVILERLASSRPRQR
jgi:drug/metabolite transporter (DMT)-like permease